MESMCLICFGCVTFNGISCMGINLPQAFADVFVEFSSSYEALIANWTHIGSLPCVQTLVLLQRATLGK